MSPADSGAGGLEGELDALYTAPLDQFVARRDALAKSLRSAGAADESRRIKALRKPSVVAWAINRLHLESNGLADIAAASEALRAALQNPRSAEERRVAIEARRKALEGATSAVLALVEAAGSSASPALLRRIERTVLAVSTGAAAGSESPAPGRLDQELEPPGFDAVLETPAPRAVAAPGPTPSRVASGGPASKAVANREPSKSAGVASVSRSSTPAASPSARPSAATVERRVSPVTRDPKRDALVRSAQKAVDDADAELERATFKVEGARATVANAEQALAAARREADAARRELAAARSRRDQLRRDLDSVRNG